MSADQSLFKVHDELHRTVSLMAYIVDKYCEGQLELTQEEIADSEDYFLESSYNPMEMKTVLRVVKIKR